MKYTLRNYQQKGVDDIKSAFKRGYRAPMYVLATAGGKTIIFSYIAQKSSSIGKNVLILVHRIELLKQASEKLTENGVSHGLINPKFTPEYHKNVQVASVQSLVRRLDKIPPPDLIIIDEGHHATSTTYMKIIDYFPNSRQLSVTATPVRTDGKGLGLGFGGFNDILIQGISIKELIELKYLASPIVYAPKKRINLDNVGLKRGDYDREVTSELFDKPRITGDAVREYTRICAFTPAVAFCISVKHAKHVAEEFRNSGYRAESIDGTTDGATRTRILNGLGDGSIHVVASCDIISEGTDIPAIGCAILLRPTKSTSLYLQQAGRALRVSDGKTVAHIIDHAGNVYEHGFPDDDREWSLKGIKKSRKKTDEEKTILTSQCENCFAVFKPQRICPNCGYEIPLKERKILHEEGELVMITEVNKSDRRTEISAAKTMAELIILQKKYKYKNGWAWALFNSRKKYKK